MQDHTKTWADMKKENKIKKSFKCILGFHKWKYAYAPYKLLGDTGRVETKICGKCFYRSTKGLFIED